MEHSGDFGARLKALRRENALTAAELGRRVGLSENAVRKLESGNSAEPRFGTGLRIARLLGVTPEALSGLDTRNAQTSLPLDLDLIARRIRARRNALAREGVRHIGVFGSFARGEATSASDVDVVVDTEPGFSLFELVGVKHILESALQRSVDVLTRQSFETSSLSHARPEVVHVF